MAENATGGSLGEQSAIQLANVTKTAPIYGAITPRWLVRLLDWKPLEAGIFRRNRVVEEKVIEVLCGHNDDSPIPSTYAEYEENPREYRLSSINAVVNIQTRIGDLFSNPYDQVREQLRVVIEGVKERQESELINNADYGLLNNIADTQRISTRKGAPTPDDLDELLTKVWKEPSIFLAHPRAIAAFGRECTRRGVPPPTVTLFGTPFLTWRGIPLIPTDKLRIAGKVPKTKMLLIRVGERKQGVIGLFQPGLTGEQSPGLSVRFMGINDRGLASYLISLYCSASVLTEDAIAVLDDVEVGQYYDYK
ncbi:MAG TPA: family 2A encapsulin nanocompartment shell protein [Silvibacterium sp.]|nr:family 2A encapsulin nanocompartment shell protein [Silvibacterium sp.]